MSGPRTISILGSTGSIGTSALSVVEHANRVSDTPAFSIDTLCAGSNAQLLIEQARQFRPKHIVIADDQALDDLREGLADLEIDSRLGR